MCIKVKLKDRCDGLSLGVHNVQRNRESDRENIRSAAK